MDTIFTILSASYQLVFLPLLQSVIIGLMIAFPLFLYFQFGPIKSEKFRQFFAIWSSIMQLSAILILVLLLISFPITLLFPNLISNKVYLDYWLCPLIGYITVHFLTYSRPLVWRAGLVSIQYEKYGRLQHWNRLTRELNERIGWKDRFTNHAVTAIRHITSRYGKFEILAPAANYGDYENVTAHKAAKALGEKVYVYASDLAATNHIESYEDELVSFSYRESVDARNLKDEFSKKKFDLIFDIKGFLWYELSGTNKRKRSEEVMMLYWNLLKPSGIIIIDGYSKRGQNIIIYFNLMLLQYFKRLMWYAEPSTYSSMRNVYKKSQLLQHHFKEVVISDGIYTLVYYQKRDTADESAA